jgi:hypothetical protein
MLTWKAIYFMITMASSYEHCSTVTTHGPQELVTDERVTRHSTCATSQKKRKRDSPVINESLHMDELMQPDTDVPIKPSVPTIMAEPATCIRGKIYADEYEILVDSGAGISVISSATFDRIPFVNKPLLTVGPFSEAVAASGVKFPLRGYAIINITLGSSEFRHPVYVSHNLTHDVILGTDFLRAHKGKIDYATNLLHLNGAPPVPILRIALFPEISKIVAAETTVIPAKHQVTVLGSIANTSVDENRDGSIGLISRDPRLIVKHKILLGTTLGQVCNGTVPLLLMNPNDRDVTIHQKTSLGTIETLGPDPEIYSMETPTSAQPAVDGNQHSLKPSHKEEPTLEELNIQIDNDDLSPQQRDEIQNLFAEYRSIFAKSNHELQTTPLVKHDVDTGDAAPIKCRMYREGPERRNIINNLVDEMEQQGLIEKSSSPWSSPVCLIKKPNGDWRFCVDYRKLNSVTKRCCWPLPSINEFFQE